MYEFNRVEFNRVKFNAKFNQACLKLQISKDVIAPPKRNVISLYVPVRLCTAPHGSDLCYCQSILQNLTVVSAS